MLTRFAAIVGVAAALVAPGGVAGGHSGGPLPVSSPASRARPISAL